MTCAWDHEYQATEDDLEDEVEWDDDAYLDQTPIQELTRQKCFRPASNPLWAFFPGLRAKTLMVRVANDVRTWHFDDPDGPELLMDLIWSGAACLYLRSSDEQQAGLLLGSLVIYQQLPGSLSPGTCGGRSDLIVRRHISVSRLTVHPAFPLH